MTKFRVQKDFHQPGAASPVSQLCIATLQSLGKGATGVIFYQEKSEISVIETTGKSDCRRLKCKPLTNKIYQVDISGCSLADFKPSLNIFFGQYLWDDFPNLSPLKVNNQRYLYLPAFGWEEGHFFDGPIVHGMGDTVFTAIPHGYPIELELTLATDQTQSDKSFDWAISFLQGEHQNNLLPTLETSIFGKVGNEAVWTVRRCSLRECVALFFLKKIFGDDLKVSKQASLNFSPPWKRYFQNLGIKEIPTNNQQSGSLESVISHVSDQRLEQVLKEILKDGPIIPHKIIESNN